MTDATAPAPGLGRFAAVVGVDPFVRRALAVLGLLTVLTALYPVVPLSGLALTVYYQVVASGSMLVAMSGVAQHRPGRRLGWLLVLGGFGCWVMADLVVSIEQHLWHGTVYPAPSDALYIAGYVVLAAGAFVF